MSVNDWLWLGFAGMAIGSVLILLVGWSRRTREEENEFLIHLFVCLTAMASYLVMATGDGAVTLAEGRDFYFARYVDWAVTTPLLLLGLCLTAMSSPFRRWAVVLGLLFTDFYMIATGLFAGLSPTGSGQKWLWFLISSGAFLFIYVALWGPVRQEAVKSGELVEKGYKTKAGALSVIWLLYPVVFLLGDEGVRSLDPVATAAAYTVLDVVAKVVYGVASLLLTRGRERQEREQGLVPDHDLRPAPIPYHEVHAPGRNERAAGRSLDGRAAG